MITEAEVNVAYLDPASWDSRMLERMRWLRRNDPVRWSEKDDCFLVSKFEDVSYASKHQNLFTSEHGVRLGNTPKIGLIDEGEPRHGKLRGLINKGFTPRMVKKLEVSFREIVKESLDAIAKQGRCEFVDDVAVPLPLLVIAEMIGIRREDRLRFHEWSDAMIRGDGARDPAIIGAAGRAFVAYATYVTEIIEDRRKNPKDDLVSILVGANDTGMLRQFDQQIDGKHRSEEQLQLANTELIMLLVILMVAGNETTRNGLSGGMQLLIENPDERQKLLARPELLPSAVEEMVRVVSPVHSFARTATQRTKLGDKTIEEGQRILLLYPSANRDEDVFEDADSFRVDRNPAHLGFGLGPHFCLGANLARMEMRVAFEELLRRFPDMEYADEEGAVVVPSSLVRSCVRMNLKFTPEA
jgi:cytochrome P450 family 142 subfamily A polypeptide 1